MTELRLSPAARAGAVLFALVTLGVLAAQLMVLRDSNDRIHAQDRKIADLRHETEPLFDALRPLVADTAPLVREATELVQPLARSADDVSRAAEQAPPLVNAVRALAGESVPLVQDLRPLIAQLRPLLALSASLLDETRRRELLRRADAAIDAVLHVEQLQTATLAAQRRSLRIQLDALRVQRQSLRHVRSVDRKTGGGTLVPPAG